jgi:hypothetical protein
VLDPAFKQLSYAVRRTLEHAIILAKTPPIPKSAFDFKQDGGYISRLISGKGTGG